MTARVVWLIEKKSQNNEKTGETFVDRNQKFLPSHRDSEEPGQEQKRGGTSTLTKRHFKGHEAVI